MLKQEDVVVDGLYGGFDALGGKELRDLAGILGVVLEWKTKDLLGKVTNYAICDFDANGTWDYGAKSDNDTLDMSFSSYSSKGDCPKRAINENYTSYLSSNEEIITLEDLSGSETMEDFEQLL